MITESLNINYVVTLDATSEESYDKLVSTLDALYGRPFSFPVAKEVCMTFCICVEGDSQENALKKIRKMSRGGLKSYFKSCDKTGGIKTNGNGIILYKLEKFKEYSPC